MPTISQLPLANGVSATDELPLSQSGTTRNATVNVLLAGTQPMITIPTGSLLGRVSVGAGQPEAIAPGTGLALQGAALVANGTDHLSFASSAGLQAGDEVVVNSRGQPMRMQATLLRALFSPGQGVIIGADGTISAPGTVGPAGPQGIPGPAGSVSSATGVVLNDVSTAPSTPSSGVVLYSQSGQLHVLGPAGLASLGGGGSPLPSGAALVGTTAGGTAQAITLGSGLTLTGTTLSVAGASYTLPPASSTTLGGVKQGANVTIASDGTISVPAPFNPASLAAVATSGSYNDLTNKPTIPAAYSLPVATTATLGGVKVGSGLTAAADGTISATYSYSLPTASSSVLGGVKVDGSSITISNGVISAVPAAPYTLPAATTAVLGGVKVGNGLQVGADGTLSTTGGGGTPYTLPAATSSVLGGVKQGSNVSIAADGTISVAAPFNPAILATVATSGSYADLSNKPTIPAAYTLPAATSSTLGGVKAGSGLTVAGDGTLSVSYSYALPTASTSVLGGVKVDGTTITASNGVISAVTPTPYSLPIASTTVLGGVKVDGSTVKINNGVISATATGNTYAATITGDGTTTSFTVTHNLGTTDVIVQVLDPANANATISTLEPTRPTTNTVVVPFSAAPASGTAFRVVVRS